MMIQSYVLTYEDLEKNHWWWRGRRRILGKILEELSSRRESRHPLSVLDVGCGTGVTLASLKDRFSCVGLEPDPFFVEKARTNAGVAIYQGSVPGEIPRFDQKFDFVLLLDVLEHVDNDLELLNAAKTLLNPEGNLVITVPALASLWSIHDEINEHKRRYAMRDLGQLIHSAGLAPVRLQFWNSCLLPFAYLHRLFLQGGVTKENYSVKTPHRLVNTLLEGLVVGEYACLRWLPIPFGLSLLAVVRLAPTSPPP